MKIQHFRNATMVMEANDKRILVDPMLGPKGTMPPLAFFRFKPKKNPMVPLPDTCRPTLEKITHCLVTHLHPDHIDKDAVTYLRQKSIPVICSVLDEKSLTKKGLNVIQTVDYWKSVPFLDGSIEGIPARHGYGFVAKPAGNVMGFYLKLPDQPSVYLSSDTIYTEDVGKVLREYKPDVSIVAAGAGQFDVFKPLLMTMEDIIKFVKDAPGKVIANHMEAINHCPTTRDQLHRELVKNDLIEKTHIPNDGDWIKIN